MELIKKLLNSRKFLVMLAGVIGLLITKYLKVEVEPNTILQFVVLISSYIVGQSIADIGTRAAKVQAVAVAQEPKSISLSEKIENVKSV